jgi:hypothetical protein
MRVYESYIKSISIDPLRHGYWMEEYFTNHMEKKISSFGENGRKNSPFTPWQNVLKFLHLLRLI